MKTLWQEIQDFLKSTGMAPSTFGKLSVRDARLVGDMKNGREPTPRVAERIRKFMSEYQP